MAAKFNGVELSSLIKDPLDYIQVTHTQSGNNCIYLSDTDVAEILSLLAKLDVKIGCGHDLISNMMLKQTSYVIAPFLTLLYNMCMQQGYFPDAYKIAQVIPLFKGRNKESCDCYRPIDLLSALGKLLEKLLTNRVMDYLERFNLLSPHQFRFRKGFGTEYAIIDIYEKLLNNLDKGLNTCSIFLDLAKAFDSVSHEILLRKLFKYGIRNNALAFFESYLSSRTQFTKINGEISSSEQIKYGVPQGSILGPLLFLIYINDLPNATSFFIKLFADDTFLCAQNKDISILESYTNVELQKVFVWLASNKLTLNLSKSKFMMTLKNKKSRAMLI